MPILDFNLLKKIAGEQTQRNTIMPIKSGPNLNNRVVNNVGGSRITPSTSRQMATTPSSFNIDNAITDGLTVLSGLGNIANGAITASQIDDTSMYENQIAGYENQFVGNYHSYDQMLGDYSRLYDIQVPTSDDIRGMSDFDKVGSIGNTALSGAMTGLSVGGPFGALAGAVVGAGAGLAGVLAGNAEADRKANNLNNMSTLAQARSLRRIQAGNEELLQYNFNNGVANAAKEGGQIERRQLSLEEFASRALRRPRVRSGETKQVIRQHCNGGTMIRIKR